jgi:hypothetical protein
MCSTYSPPHIIPLYKKIADYPKSPATYARITWLSTAYFIPLGSWWVTVLGYSCRTGHVCGSQQTNVYVITSTWLDLSVSDRTVDKGHWRHGEDTQAFVMNQWHTTSYCFRFLFGVGYPIWHTFALCCPRDNNDFSFLCISVGRWGPQSQFITLLIEVFFVAFDDNIKFLDQWPVTSDVILGPYNNTIE